jgi:branched-chain amino acid transport system ATP-binding protein
MLFRRPAVRQAAAAGHPAHVEARDVTVRYGDVVALHPLSLTIERGTVLAVLGPNGAGKTSLANALSGVVSGSRGSITLDGVEIGSLAPHQRARLGVGHLPDSRAIFPSLSVAENLRVGFHRRNATLRQDMDAAYEQFPHLARRKNLPAGRLSGGEQQMLALARLMIAPPRLLIIDELSHGLAPGVVASLFQSLTNLKGSCSMLVIEQFVSRAVSLADNVLVLSHGDVKHVGPAAEFSTELAAEFYSLHAGDGSGRAPQLA